MSGDNRRRSFFGWGVYLNSLNWKMEFRPLSDDDARDLCVRNLSARDLLRFGDWDDRTTSRQRFSKYLRNDFHSRLVEIEKPNK
uniref:Uncharacterized protein n=1 Tax=Romanomermis culicivorax TaxID=13658 RepID=A0A915L6K1_ROMCU